MNLLVGVVLAGLMTFATLGFLLSEYHRPVFAPANAWLWVILLASSPLGLVLAVIGMRRQIGCGYFIWSQLVLSVLVVSMYIGWYRRELDYVKMGPDPDALEQGPPIATVSGLMVAVLLWLVVGFLPLMVRQGLRWMRDRRALAQTTEPNSPANEA